MKMPAADLCDRVILFFCCLAAYFSAPEAYRDVTPILAAVLVSSLLDYLPQKAAAPILTALFLVWCTLMPSSSLFLPLILYNALFSPCWPICLLAAVPLIRFSEAASVSSFVFLCILLVLSGWLRRRTSLLENLKTERNQLRDSARELSMKLKRQNRELLEKQDAEISSAALQERGRIAREIHDSVGHLLSSALLQVGALLAINRDEKTRGGLSTLHDTLNEAMNSIRRSVHDLHDESIDLYEHLYRLTKSFSFCPLAFRYELETDPPAKVKYAFLAITKEGLTNIVRHSKATAASLLLREHPGFYQFILQDNGHVEDYRPENGIGLQNIHERVETLHGVVNITAENGFRIFISIPKGETKQ